MNVLLSIVGGLVAGFVLGVMFAPKVRAILAEIAAKYAGVKAVLKQ